MQVPMEILHLLLLLLSSSTLPNPASSSPSPSDPLSNALLTFKSHITDPSNSLTNWQIPTPIPPPPQTQTIHACTWTGITCTHTQNSTKLTSINLSNLNLSGSISDFDLFHLFTDLTHLNLSHNSFSSHLPASIFTLTRLQTLDVSRNNFSGEFPAGISALQNLTTLDAFSNSFSGPLPTDVAEIDSLRVLNFAGSYFSGPIPVEYGNFRSIEFLHLAGNYLTGNLPVELGMMKTVSHMEIGYNLYEGEIPWQFGNLTELRYLDIADANLSGPIPVQLSNLTKVESLFLFRNQLIGKIPDEFGGMFALKSLDLSDNLIYGPIPETFSNLENLKLLSLMYNDMSGDVPRGIARLKELDTLLIWNNYFTGSLPEDLGKHSKLQHLDVSTNYFVGSIPPGICAGGELLKLILFSNNFTGGLVPALSNCSSLVRLRLEDNSFSGELSLRFGDYKDLSYVDLSRNRFVGGVVDIGEALSLEYFNVSDNPGLGGVVPMSVWSLDNLQNFSMNSCGLSGSVPEFGSCKALNVIELRNNNLSGSIPGNVSNCKELQRIDLAENHLTGMIPVELAEIPVISVLDLSDNSLWGRIPAEFGHTSSLKLLNVSYNDISGSIPPEKVFIMMDQSAFLGNPKLCGAPYRPCHRGISNGLQLGSGRAQNVAWILILCAFIVLFIMAALFGILHFRKYSRGRWKMVAFDGMPHFKEKDILKSSSRVELGNVILPAGMTVSVKKIEWEPESVKVALGQLTFLGNARHKNLTRLLGVLYNKNMVYLLYENLPNGSLAEQIGEKRDWEIKRKIVVGVARGLCFLHHECFPAISHGNLKASNVLLDENMEPHLAEFGLNSIVHTFSRPHLPVKSMKETGAVSTSIREELHKDVYDFGGLILEILTNGRLANAQNTPRDVLVKEVAMENGIVPSHISGSELLSFVDVALLCRRSGPSIQDVLKLLSELKPHTNGSGLSG